MKCDELKPLVFSINDFAYIDEPAVQKNFENPHDHAVYKATEVDAAIAELKEVAEDACLERDDNQNAIDELQAEHHKERHEYIKMIAELKQKLEDAKATAYAESVDAGMENRRLKRALWIARAERAADRERIFYFNDLETMLDIDGFSYDSKKKKGHKKLTARRWRIIWQTVERKCLKKAKEYK